MARKACVKKELLYQDWRLQIIFYALALYVNLKVLKSYIKFFRFATMSYRLNWGER